MKMNIKLYQSSFIAFCLHVNQVTCVAFSQLTTPRQNLFHAAAASRLLEKKSVERN